MKKTIKLASIVLLFTIVTSIFTACVNENAGKDKDTIAIEKELSTIMKDIYKSFNENDFENYLKYYDVSEDEKSAMLENLIQLSNSFDTKYKFDSILANKMENGDVSAQVTAVTTSTDLEDNKKVVIKEITHYMFAKKDDGWKIKEYTTGKSEIISD